MTRDNKSAVFTTNQASDYLNIGIAGMKEQVKLGKLVARKIGNKTVYLRSDLDRFLNQLPKFIPSKIKPQK